MNLDLQRDFFDLFGLPRSYELDVGRLEQTYRDLQNRVHPDRFAHLPEADRRMSMQWATRVNEGFRVLRSPISRAEYLLALHGHPVSESGTALPPAFLMEQMEWREAVEEARAGRDEAGLGHLLHRVKHQQSATLGQLEQSLDTTHDYLHAVESVKRLMFLDKVRADIDAALEALEDI